jgi:hypothetical protein
MLLKGPRSHTSSNTSFSSLQLVLRASLLKGPCSILLVTLRLLVSDMYSMLLKAPRSHTSRIRFTGSQLVLHVVYYMSIALILPVLLHLLVHDWYDMQVYWRGLALIPPVLLRFTGSWLVLRTSLMKGTCSHTSSNAQITSSRLVLYVTEGASIPYFRFYSVYVTP